MRVYASMLIHDDSRNVQASIHVNAFSGSVCGACKSGIFIFGLFSTGVSWNFTDFDPQPVSSGSFLSLSAV